MKSANIIEIFASLQGEGIGAGDPQIFVRFAGCNLCCSYCDTPESRHAAGGRLMSTDDVLKEIMKLSSNGKYKTVSLTGGEPLLENDFLQELLPRIKQHGLRVYLETNGTKPEAVRGLLPWIDDIAMDIKLGSDGTGYYWDEHRRFLVNGKGKIFVKLVVTARTDADDVARSIKLIAEIDPAIPLVIQPVTPSADVKSAMPDTIEAWHQQALAALHDVRVLSQQHIAWNVR
jgi:organic radical activating enzyme